MVGETTGSRVSRVRPAVAWAVAVWLAYAALTFVIQANTGVPYADWFKTGANAWRTAVASLVAGSLLLIGFLAWARWDHVMRDPVRLPTPRWMTALLWLWWALIAIRCAAVRWGDVPTDLLVPVLATGVLVGFAEETLFRGIVLRGLREGGRSEAWAALLTAVGFGLLHLPNAFLGTGLAGLAQVPIAGLSGALLYVFRRRFGSILPAMVAHGAWDISTFLAGSYAAEWLSPFTLLGLVLTVGTGLAVLVSVFRHDRSTVVIPRSAS